LQFENTVNNTVKGEMFNKKFPYDLLIDFSEINYNYIKILSRMSPFGLGNKRPVFRTNDCTINEKLKFVGKESQIVKSTIIDSLGNKLPFICFDKKDQLIDLNSKFDILYTISINSFSDKNQVELTIKEINLKK
jgi:single-stranded-DNA-specific exonuclease